MRCSFWLWSMSEHQWYHEQVMQKCHICSISLPPSIHAWMPFEFGFVREDTLHAHARLLHCIFKVSKSIRIQHLKHAACLERNKKHELNSKPLSTHMNAFARNVFYSAYADTRAWIYCHFHAEFDCIANELESMQFMSEFRLAKVGFFGYKSRCIPVNCGIMFNETQLVYTLM